MTNPSFLEDISRLYGLPRAVVRTEDINPQRNIFQEVIDREKRRAINAINYRMDQELATMVTATRTPPALLPERVVPPLPSLPTTVEAPKVVDVKPKPEVLDFVTRSYMRKVHAPDELLETAQELLAGIEYDTLVGTGLSGTLAVAELARKLDKKYLVVRKPDDGSHSCYPAEGRLGKRWIFVDDLVGSGRTLCRVWDTLYDLAKESNFDTEFIGAMLYSDYAFVSPVDARRRGWFYYSKRYDGQYGKVTRRSAW